MEIDTSTTQPQLESTKANLAYINLERKRLKAASNGKSFGTVNSDLEDTQKGLYQSSLADLRNQLQAKNSEIRGIDVEISDNQHQLTINSAKERRMNNVSDIIAKNDLDKVISENVEYRSKILELRHQKAKSHEEANYIRSNFKTKNFEDLADFHLDISCTRISVTSQNDSIDMPHWNCLIPILHLSLRWYNFN